MAGKEVLNQDLLCLLIITEKTLQNKISAADRIGEKKVTSLSAHSLITILASHFTLGSCMLLYVIED